MTMARISQTAVIGGAATTRANSWRANSVIVGSAIADPIPITRRLSGGLLTEEGRVSKT